MNDFALQKIEDFICDVELVNPEFAQVIELVRDMFAKACEELLLDIKYGGLVFFKRGELVAGVFPYTNHLSIEFSNGVAFSDPFSRLEGKGKKRRHLKIYKAEDIETKNALFFVKQAVGE
ncbi:MAG: DUF1801 domain-containing protein [Thiomicrorhabdus sp.]|nr:DUF1801 domain-containing protein [Thiomicrorhabdus sp.]